MSKPEFGDLEQQNPRDFWPHEAADFTLWLARPENIARLSQAVGLELEVQSVEEPVGPFNADIVCTSLGDHRRVVIENQLERSDHDHLGKMRRSCVITKKTWSVRKVRVCTVKKSQAQIAAAWRRRNVRQLGEGGGRAP